MEEQYLYRYPKRRRLERRCKILNYKFPVYQEKVTITDLAPEILQTIFKWIPAQGLVLEAKPVCKYFEAQVNDLLYRKFVRLYSRLRQLHNMSVNIFNAAQHLRMRKRMFNILSNIDAMIYEYKIMEATVWRYIRFRRTEFVFCMCFGKILDMFDYIFHKMYCKDEHFKYQKIVKTLFQCIRSFICHFESHTEVNINENCFVSGAKICDILDACIFSRKEIIYEKYESGMCYLKLLYLLPNAWFFTIPLDDSSQSSARCSWQDQQRTMYLRLRRLVSSYTGHQMKLHHWEKSRQLVALGLPELVKIGNRVYCGYGEFDKELFFYGNFNQGGYICKVAQMEHRQITPEESNPCSLEIIINLSCSIEQAPWQIYQKYCLHFDNNPSRIILRRRSARLEQRPFNMTVEFHTDFQKSFLPPSYFYTVSEDARMKMVQKVSKFIEK